MFPLSKCRDIDMGSVARGMTSDSLQHRKSGKDVTSYPRKSTEPVAIKRSYLCR